MKAFARKFYSSSAWLKCRKAYISMREASDGGICERCHENPGYIIHHRVELTPDNISDPNVSLSFDNLMYVCHDCHNVIHGNVMQLPERSIRYEFMPDGSPVPVGEAPRR